MDNVTHEEIAVIVTDALRAVLTSPELHCRYRFDPEKHDLEHEALRKFIKVVGRFEDVKWGVFQKVIAAIVFAAFGLMLYGGMVKLKILGGLGLLGR